MKRRNALSLLLSLTLLLSLALPATTAYADDSSSGSGMEISKTAVANADGSYTITLEAYATGSKVITEIKNDVPTDIILVLDQSGSMADDIGAVSYKEYTGNDTRNSSNYNRRHNGGSANLWYKLSDSSYVSVSVTKKTEYTPLSALLVNYETGWFDLTKDCYYYYANNLYEKVGEEYKKVEVNRQARGSIYTYTFYDGTKVTSTGDSAVPDFGNHAPLYTPAADGANTVYTYTYTDKDGNVQTIGTSTGASTRYTPAFYQRTTIASGVSRLNALKSAVTNFANQVATKAAGADGTYGTKDDINHRIAVVGFAMGSEGYYGWGESIPAYENTEVFIGATGHTYPDANSDVYSNAFQNMNETAGKANIDASIGALAANGATQVDLGMNMAQRILNANPVTSGEKRNRVVIVFTDGAPTTSNSFNKSVANSAINTSSSIKNAGATVYSVGIFSGADATSAGTEPSGNLNDGSNAIPAASNWFMQKLSSNNGTPQSPSYYLSAADAGSLNSIFQQISSNIETGGSSSTLTSDAVVKDIISPQFTLPAGATASNITLETYACTGKNTNGDYTWRNNNNTMGATASISGDQVSVTGFNFSDNYVGTVTENGTTTYRGNKLVISFKVEPKAGFLGGNDVYTNTSAGIYENDSAEKPLLTFDRPAVNVPIQSVTVEAKDKNVYLLGSVTADDLKSGATVKVGDVELDLKEANNTDKPYGLEAWQTEYVEITVKVTDSDGNEINASDLTNLTEDKKFTVEVTVTPKNTNPKSTQGEQATVKTGTDTKNIYVFKPELTFKDSTAYYGETVPTNNDYSSNYVANSEKWKNGDKNSTDSDVKMLGEKPELKITYTPDETKLEGGKYTKQDVPVKATVKIGTDDVNTYTTFVHKDCDPACGWTPTTTGDPAFLIHIKTCELTVNKSGGNTDEPYVFTVYKDNVKYSEVTVMGNGSETIYELPIGTYTISENEGWSWRYSADDGGSAELTAQNPIGSITCINTKNNDQWLNGFSTVVQNIFGMKH